MWIGKTYKEASEWTQIIFSDYLSNVQVSNLNVPARLMLVKQVESINSENVDVSMVEDKKDIILAERE